MSITKAVGSGFRKYAVFKGRSSRSEYWWWLLLVIIGYGVFAVAVGEIGIMLWALAVILPQLAVTIRRLHDIDKSGWWVLLGFTPILAAYIPIFLIWWTAVVILFIFAAPPTLSVGIAIISLIMAKRGTEGPNRFGEDPLQA